MNSLQNDNVYPNSTARFFPQIAKEAQKTIQEEVEQTLNQLPVLKEVLKHLDATIAATDSVKKALEISEKYQISRENALIVLDIVNQQLTPERSYIAARVERATKR